jgi:periplasmic protein CpxP/Spy
MKGLNTIKATALAAVLSLAAAAPIALAQTTGGTDTAAHPHAWAHHGENGFFGGLNLTDAQKAQLKQLHESTRQAIEPLAQQIRAKRQELWQLQKGTTFDQAAAQAKLAEIVPLEAQMMAEQFRARQEMLNVLTPEQKAQLEQRKADWQKQGAGFKGRMGGRHEHGEAQPNQ